MKQKIVVLLTIIAICCCCTQTVSAQPQNHSNSRKKVFTPNDIQWNDRIEEPNLSEAQFTELVANAIRSVSEPGSTINILAPLAVSAKSPDGTMVQFYFANAWNLTKNTPGTRREKLAKVVLLKEDLVDVLIERLNKREYIVPIVRSREEALEISRMTNGKQISYYEPFVGDLVFQFAVDSPTAIHSLDTKEFADLKVSKEELRKIAMENFKRLRSSLHVSKPNKQLEIYSINVGGDYESTILLADKFWEEDAKVICPKGNIVACAPTRSDVYFASDSDSNAIDRLRKAAKQIYDNGDHVISAQLLRRTRNGWEVFESPLVTIAHELFDSTMSYLRVFSAPLVNAIFVIFSIAKLIEMASKVTPRQSTIAATALYFAPWLALLKPDSLASFLFVTLYAFSWYVLPPLLAIVGLFLPKEYRIKYVASALLVSATPYVMFWLMQR